MKVANILSDIVSLLKGILSTGLLLVSEYHDQTESLPFDISVLLLEGVKKGKGGQEKTIFTYFTSYPLSSPRKDVFRHRKISFVLFPLLKQV